MKINVFMLLIILLLAGCNPDHSSGYEFNGKISETVLRNYLSRAVTHAELCTHPGYMQDGPNTCIEDDLRMLKSIDAKFIGRSFYRWGMEGAFNDPEFMAYARQIINRVHERDPEVIFQAAIFETVSTGVETVSVPDYVFKDYGLPVES